ncbi:MAG: SPOR domain-containing protein [Azoarcus sp.]|jgi:cell division septation protein DedD|nr:SPOR domain-containing protein [Azoarcus sp.]
MNRRSRFSTISPRRVALTRAGIAIVAGLSLLSVALWFDESGNPQPLLTETVPLTFNIGNNKINPSSAAAAQTSHDTSAGEAAIAMLATDPPASGVARSVASPTPEAALITETPSQTQTTPLPDGYFVQLGVFSSIDNAQSLVDNAKSLGLPAHLQARVIVGPFDNKREANAARGRLGQIAEGVVVPPQKGAKTGRPNAKPKKKRHAK